MKLQAFPTSALYKGKKSSSHAVSSSVPDRAVHAPLSAVLSGAIRWEGTRNTYYKDLSKTSKSLPVCKDWKI